MTAHEWREAVPEAPDGVVLGWLTYLGPELAVRTDPGATSDLQVFSGGFLARSAATPADVTVDALSALRERLWSDRR